MTFGSSSIGGSERASAAALALLAILLTPSITHAADAADADALFREGRALLDAGEPERACEKLSASQRLERAAGTALALGMCHEARGRLASASQSYLEAESLGRATDRPALADAARRRAAALEPRLSRLEVRVDAPVEGLEIRLDGLHMPSTRWSKRLAVDPGDHVIDATAPGHESARFTVTVGKGAAAEASFVLPRLRALAPAGLVAVRSVSHEGAPPSGAFQRGAGLAIAAAGAVGVGVGSYFGLRALDRGEEARSLCPLSPCTDARGVSLNEEARSSALASTVALSAGASAIVVGAILLLTAPRGLAPRRGATGRVEIAPSAPGAAVGLSLSAEAL